MLCNNLNIFRAFFVLKCLLLPISVTAANYWVSKSGNDNNDCSSELSSCLTIQKGVSLLKAGDVLNVAAGTYSDNGGVSQYKPNNTFCGWLDSVPSSSNVCIDINGTKNNPIIIKAKFGDEGKVVIDGGGERIGFHIQNSDYIYIDGFKIINTYVGAIASWGQVENEVADESRLSIGVQILNNEISKVRGPYGKNISGIAMWGAKDWVIRNNKIRDVLADGSTRASGIQSYGVVNALVENNDIADTDFGIFWKDHYVKNAQTRESVFESEIRYNIINTSSYGVQFGIRGTNTVESGENHVHHNIIYGYSGAGIALKMSGAKYIGGKLRIENNLLDSRGRASMGISADSCSGAYLSGNIFIDNVFDIELISYTNQTKQVALKYSDYNVYDSSFSIIAARYSSNSKSFSSLNSWSQDSKVIYPMLDSAADFKSVLSSSASLFIDKNSLSYKYHQSSVAKGIMPDGSNAGPYQTGSETVGLLPRWPGAAKAISDPPSNVDVKLIWFGSSFIVKWGS